MMLRTQLSLQRSMHENYNTSSRLWRNVIIPDCSSVQGPAWVRMMTRRRWWLRRGRSTHKRNESRSVGEPAGSDE